MMTYTDCPTCEDNKHGLETCELSMDIICTCPICNALGIANLIKTDDTLTEKDINYHTSNLAWHLEHMNPSDLELFQYMSVN